MGLDAGYYPRDVADSMPSFHGYNAVVGNLQLRFGNVALKISLSSFGIFGLLIWLINKLRTRPEKKITRLVNSLSITLRCLALLAIDFCIGHTASHFLSSIPHHHHSARK
jgi:peptidoglycan biosynthesis protein MviN/MurJ (putative lipid II flippase)